MTTDVLGAGFSDTQEIAVVVTAITAVGVVLATALDSRGFWRWRDRP